MHTDEYTVKQLPKLPGNAFRRGHSAIRWGMPRSTNEWRYLHFL